MVVDLGSDLRPEDFLYSGINIEAQLSTYLLIKLFATWPNPKQKILILSINLPFLYVALD